MGHELDIKKIRETLGMTQALFALEVGVDQSTISNWENGQVPRGPARRVLATLDAKAKAKEKREAKGAAA